MAVFVFIETVCLAKIVVQLDRFVARIQPLAILPPLPAIISATSNRHLCNDNYLQPIQLYRVPYLW